MKKITFTNANGDSLEIAQSIPFFLQEIRGLGAPLVTPLVQTGYNQDGTSYYGSLMQPRNIDIDVYVKGASLTDIIQKRRLIFDVFNPKLGEGTLVYSNDIGSWQISGTVYDGPAEINGISSPYIQRFQIGLYCPDPAFKSIAQNKHKLVGFVGGLEVPVIFPFSLATQGDLIEIEYTGDLDAPLLIEFRGAATNPKITKEETGETIEVAVSLESDQSLWVDTTPNNIDVYTETDGLKVSAFNDVKSNNKYFMLTSGKNTLSFSAASGDPEVYLYWYTQYVGV